MAAIEGARAGRVLKVEGSTGARRLLLDIGTKAGLDEGALVSVGGIGPEHGVWRVTTAKPYYCRAERLPGAADRLPAKGDPALPVRRTD